MDTVEDFIETYEEEQMEEVIENMPYTLALQDADGLGELLAEAMEVVAYCEARKLPSLPAFKERLAFIQNRWELLPYQNEPYEDQLECANLTAPEFDELKLTDYYAEDWQPATGIAGFVRDTCTLADLVEGDKRFNGKQAKKARKLHEEMKKAWLAFGKNPKEPKTEALYEKIVCFVQGLEEHL